MTDRRFSELERAATAAPGDILAISQLQEDGTYASKAVTVETLAGAGNSAKSVDGVTPDEQGNIVLNAFTPDNPPPFTVFSPDTPGSVMLAVLRAIPADYPLLPTAENTRTVLFPENGYLIAGESLSYGAMTSGGLCISFGTRYFTGSWALLSGLVMDYNSADPARPNYGNCLVQSVDVSGSGLETIASARYLADEPDWLTARFVLKGGSTLGYTAWRDSPDAFCREVYHYCTTRLKAADDGILTPDGGPAA